jgi:hypothetical protein
MARWAERDPVAEADLATHAADTTGVHGIADTALLETLSGAQAKADTAATTAEALAATALAAHQADTTGVHGIADSALLESITGAQAKADAARDAAKLASDPRWGRCGSIRVYGSSLAITEGHLNIYSDRWSTKLAVALGALPFGAERNYGVGGSKLLVNQNISGWAQIWQHQGDRLPTIGSGGLSAGDDRPPSQGLIALLHGINDYGSFGSQGTFQTAFAKALEAITRMLRAGFVWRTTSGRFTSTGWSNATSSAYGGAYLTRSTPGNIVFTTPPGFTGGTLTFYLAVRPDANEASRVQASIDGGATVVTVDATGVGVTGQWSPVAIVVPNVPAGSGHTVTLAFDNVGAGGTGRFIGATQTSKWPPMILLIGQPYTPTMPPTSEPLMTTGVVDGGNASHAAVAGMFSDGKVIYVDLTSMNSDASYWQDDVHYNPKGNAQIATLCLNAIAAAGGVPAAFSAGPVNDFAGTPDWSGAPGTQGIFDPATGKLWLPNSVTAGDWKAMQPNDPDLDAIAALVTTAFGRSTLTLADAAALRALAALGDIATHNVAEFDAAGAAATAAAAAQAAAIAASQPLDTDLTDFGALTPANDDIPQRKAGHWVNRTLAQVSADLGSVGYVFDTHANRIAAAHRAGRIWLETDTGLKYYDDGAAWQIWDRDGIVRKTADETVNNSAVLQNDDHLFFPIEPNERWWVEAFLLVQGLSGTPDFNLGWTGPAGATALHALEQNTNSAWSEVGTGGTPVAMKTIAQALSVGTGNSTFGLSFRAHFFAGANAGTIRMQWAQATATAEDLKVLADSFLRLKRLA